MAKNMHKHGTSIHTKIATNILGHYAALFSLVGVSIIAYIHFYM